MWTQNVPLRPVKNSEMFGSYSCRTLGCTDRPSQPGWFAWDIVDVVRELHNLSCTNIFNATLFLLIPERRRIYNN